MINNKKTLIAIFALTLPLIVLSGLWAKAATHQSVGEQIWQVEIKGYDPRDPLYGHYLRYRFDWNIVENSNSDTEHKRAGTQMCLCLNNSGSSIKDPAAYPVQCKAPTNKSCESVMKIYKHGSRYALKQSSEPERFFIPEENSKHIDRLFREGKTTFRMELMAHKDNSVAIRALFVEDIPLDQYLRSLPPEQSAKH